MVDDLRMAKPRAAPHLRQKVGRIGHAFHAARDHDPGLAKRDLVEGHHRRLHARAAHLVQCRGRNPFGQARPEPRLPRGRLAQTGGQDATHQQFLDLIGPRPGIGQRRRDGGPAKRRGVGSGEDTL